MAVGSVSCCNVHCTYRLVPAFCWSHDAQHEKPLSRFRALHNTVIIQPDRVTHTQTLLEHTTKKKQVKINRGKINIRNSGQTCFRLDGQGTHGQKRVVSECIRNLLVIIIELPHRSFRSTDPEQCASGRVRECRSLQPLAMALIKSHAIYPIYIPTPPYSIALN